MPDTMSDECGVPKIADRATFQVQLDTLRVREKAHTHEGDAMSQPVGGFRWSKWTEVRS